MILADTSIWINHLFRGNAALAAQLEWGRIACHPAVIGELACGRFRDRAQVLELMQRLPRVSEVTHEDVMALIEKHQLMGSGIGWVDMHLLATSLLSDVPIWTLDKRLAEAATRLGIAHVP